MKMNFSEKFQLIRKNKGMTQEELAEKLDISREAVAKWESGQAYPDISNPGSAVQRRFLKRSS